MWAKVAEEMAVPWRAAEAMHWQLGEADMARRAGVVPFSLNLVNVDTSPGGSGARSSPSRSHVYPPSDAEHAGHSRFGHQRGTSLQHQPTRTIAARRDCTPRSVPLPSPIDGIALAGIGNSMAVTPGRGGMLPSLAEMTTGVSPYNTPAYTMQGQVTGYTSPATPLPPVSFIGVGRPDSRASNSKRAASPEMMARESSRRRY
jgi:hypothetical protein